METSITTLHFNAYRLNIFFNINLILKLVPYLNVLVMKRKLLLTSLSIAFASIVIAKSSCKADYFKIVASNPDSTKEQLLTAFYKSNPHTVLFYNNSSVLNSTAQKVLDGIITELKTDPSKKATVTAHLFDPTGPAPGVMRLLKDMANSVKTYLVNNGIDAKRVKIKNAPGEPSANPQPVASENIRKQFSGRADLVIN
jgi:hypothetical protein